MERAARPAFGILLRRYRRAAGLTQEELAERMGYSTVHIGMLERGERRPRAIILAVLAKALALTPRERALLETAAQQHDGAPPAGAAARSVPPLVGRARELEALLQHLLGEGPAVLLLAGAPGIGKTRLLQEATTRGDAYGWRVLEGGCQRQEGEEPYAPLRAALERYLVGRTPRQRLRDLAGCEWLARLLPELLETPAPAWTLSPEQERRQVVKALGQFAHNVAGPAGTLLVLDDLQWAEPDALELLVALVQTTEAPLRVVGAYRETEVQPGDPLTGALASLARTQALIRVATGPLARKEAGRLLDRLLEDWGGDADVDRARVLERAAGVPFALASYARALPTQAEEGAADTPSRDLAQSVQQRVAALPAGARQALEALAVIGRAAPWRLLVELAPSTEDVRPGLEAACRARLVEEDSESYHFTHDVIREVVERDLGMMRQLTLHRRLAQALEREGASAEVLAYHCGRGGLLDQAVRYLEMAGDRACAQAAYVAAEGYYREALEGLSEPAQARDAARVREKLAGLLVTLGRYREALVVLAQAEQSYRDARDVEGEARAVAHSGTVHGYQATPEEALPRVQAAIQHLEARGGESPSPALAALYGALHILFQASHRPAEQLAAAARAAEVGRAVGDVKSVVRAGRSQGTALTDLGRLDEARRVLEGTLALADTLGDVYVLCSVLDTLALTYLAAGDLERSRDYWERALDIARRTGDRVDMAYDASGLGLALFYLGDWAAARAYLEQAVETMGPIGSSWVAAAVDLRLAQLSLAEGAWEQALSCLQNVIAGAASRHDRQALERAHGLYADWELFMGEARSALRRLEPFVDEDGPAVPWVLSLAATSYLELGEVDRADELAARAVARAQAYDRIALVEALQVRGMTLARLGRHDEARQALDGALARARAMQYPYGEGRALYTLALTHLKRRERQQAQRHLEAALAIFRRLGARMDVQRAEQALTALHQAWRDRADAQVTDAQWARIEVLLPAAARTGRPRADDRRTLEAILYVQRTGCAWRDLPVDLGDDRTAQRRLREWQATGLWERIAAMLQDMPAHG